MMRSPRTLEFLRMTRKAAIMSETQNEAVWDDPLDPETTYMFDRMHFPFPLSPLWQSTAAVAFAPGFTAAFEHYNAPLDRYLCTYRNNYHFETYVPKVPANDDEARAMHELAERTLGDALPGMRQRWETEHLPVILETHARLKEIADAESTSAATPENVDAVREALATYWGHHFVIVMPMLLAMQLFDEFHVELFGAEADSHKLLAGMESESVKTGHALSDLALRARELGLAPVIRETPIEELFSTLEETEAGRVFSAEFQSTLSAIGLRQDLFDFLVPTWIEDPSIPLLQIRHYVETGRDNREETAERAQAAEDATRQSREALASYPEQVREQWEAFLGFSREAMFLQEEHNYFIDQQGTALARLALLNIGRGLTESGAIAEPADIFMLSFEELNQATRSPDADFKAVAAQRSSALELSGKLLPPPFVGPPPAGPPPSDNPLMRGLQRFFGGPPQEIDDPGLVRGTAGSRGIATGMAYVARTLEEATRIQPGQILVAITTMPPWTPLFGVAAAVVTETGGPLSHCAIVAREYNIPAVVGAHGATHRISTGQKITVDGTSGIVTLHDE